MRKSKAMSAGGRTTLDQDPVVQGILKAISLKRLRPGMKLGEIELASAFGTNRTHVRQVLSHLGSRDLVTLIPNRGAFVSQCSPEEARAVFDTRKILERAAISAALDHFTPDMARDLSRLVALEKSHSHNDRWDGLDLSASFHVEIARLSGNPVLVKFMEELTLRTSLIIAQYEMPGSEDRCPEAHPGIAERILARDKAGAIAAMDRHLADMQARLKLDGRGESDADIAAIFQDLGIVPKARPGARRRD
ncbi:GntR family transcriptional regulator [Rhodoplanes sp. TEM]|uniref:GntR family transcriptional regulator n=1 Tax=Rhodoplanes tepidamans TaxID=200616 RepID=A0ABT5JD54_RHOTP|nr:MULTISPECIES: GntR family transcriptional regulator [Rhodoplanes]MDC7787618.1 GntR family transcriptional regulator [Rhodoplanes tepidamans]MDC7984566.1 GntR family transcriptional regulator [Rhodoplanes sp. TEM]MDQ0355187.1 DNA-binding GntR family transcriptional regulator [Rhodoplanes tepidamans]